MPSELCPGSNCPRYRYILTAAVPQYRIVSLLFWVSLGESSHISSHITIANMSPSPSKDATFRSWNER
jgi:hypothetical protein